MSEQITPADAVETLGNAVALVRATLQEHQVLQQCLQVLRDNNAALEAIKAEQKAKGQGQQEANDHA